MLKCMVCCQPIFFTSIFVYLPLVFYMRNNFIRNWGSNPQKVKKFLRRYSRLKIIGKIRIRNCWALINEWFFFVWLYLDYIIDGELNIIDVIMLGNWFYYLFVHVNLFVCSYQLEHFTLVEWCLVVLAILLCYCVIPCSVIFYVLCMLDR